MNDKLKNQLKLIYEVVFIILSLIAVTIAFLDIIEKINLDASPRLLLFDTGITYIFIADYFIRLVISKSKKQFFQSNIPDLIAIIPFNSLFKVFRIAKLFRLAKLGKIGKLSKIFRFIGVGGRLHRKIKRVLKTNGLNYALWFAFLIIGLGSIGIYIAEKGQTIDDFPDAVWWSFVTATTVGYGDISPSTQIGRIIAAILMITGIGTIGMITGAISTYFISQKEDERKEEYPEKSAENLILSSDDLLEAEKDEVIKFISFIKHKRNS